MYSYRENALRNRIDAGEKVARASNSPGSSRYDVGIAM